MTKNLSLQDEVKAFVHRTMSQIKINWSDEVGRIASVCQALKIIIDEFGIEKYEFTLAMDVFVETSRKDLSICLESIIDIEESFEDEDRRAICFAAYYALSIIKKKEDDLEGLFRLIDEKYKRAFSIYPLHFEVHSRYYKRVGEYEQALRCDNRAINYLKNRRDIVNVGLLISYASTVCTMLEKRDPLLSEEYVERAFEYVNEAISINDIYPKYPFIKAQLIFLSAMHEGADLDRLSSARKEAIRLIGKSDDLLYEFYQDQNQYVEKEKARYEKFTRYMDRAIKGMRYPVSQDELDKLKERILTTESHNECACSDLLPPNPDLHDGDKYVFICYSSADYKTVYCDLIEFYKQKIHFMYDRRLKNAIDWDKQVTEKICDEDCIGVVFYISKNTLATEAVSKEIKITEDLGKEHFCVNLEDVSPSMFLIDYIIERYEKDKNNYYISSEKMRRFLDFFDDSAVFVRKMKKYGESGQEHIKTCIDALREKFTDIIIGD